MDFIQAEFMSTKFALYGPVSHATTVPLPPHPTYRSKMDGMIGRPLYAVCLSVGLHPATHRVGGGGDEEQIPSAIRFRADAAIPERLTG